MSSPALNPQLGSTSGSLTVTRGQAEDAGAWDQFVNNHPEGRYCHLWGYKQALERAYGYHCVYLKFLHGEKLIGVFPSIRIRRRQGWLISQPFNEYGGPLTQTSQPASTRN